ncbi:MAG: FHA domain-containing protein [Planctomycetes bacterium]|nr:FHA domain-containing protein [Planctomycetota bacterium]
MSIKFACSCGKAYKVPEKFSGKRVKCKQCGEPIRVPSESESGVASTRAAAVSKRSVLTSQRLDAKKSGRTSTRAPAAPAPRRAGSGTERFEPVDLTEGNQLKQYAKKRTDEEFKRGEGRLTLFEATGKPSKAFRLGKDDATIGRGDGCVIKVPVASVSKEHAKLEYKLGTFIVTDLQSSNGVLVNGRVVRRASLKDGDILQLGEAVLRIDC